MDRIQSNTRLGRLLAWLVGVGGSDLHGQAGKPFRFRANGILDRVPESEAIPPTEVELDAMIGEAFAPATAARIRQARELDLSVDFDQVRFRVNCSKQQGRQSFSFRVVPRQTYRLADLQLPSSLSELISIPRGLILITGPTGQGKSTTARALIEEINVRQKARIITIEDPIEFLFEDKLAQFEQREVGVDTDSFARGIRNAMRQDPNVLFVGEIRDAESIFCAMQAAETGHLVLTTLHADTVAQAIGRIREYYPAEQRDGISGLLGRNLAAILCQRLLPNCQGGRTPCLELLKRDAGVQSAIVANDLSLLTGIMESSTHLGMHTFDQYLLELCAEEIVSQDTARRYAMNPHRLEMLLGGIAAARGILRPDPNR
ncbi:MAG TPA: PilT/PilU family type 4a pilus ATPase [Candidatus Paceibacterota bacterium]|nr:PilT/PilU family type 4a pilus ATPase [Verrucomicrobiota bacterium]HRY49017.1 PilT/PilU family type 4a pilus ATPase [Candidatus Paceibacterota bacterium]HRZ99514.1 PilT/PilU family type 4a pilus ATPase [Candidatus Paceibacterota bacterium]